MLLYEGKAKKIFSIDGVTDQVLVEYKDSLTAFNALKKGSFENKGQINRNITSLIFKYLANNGVATHWISDEGVIAMRVQKLNIIPLEVVVRNTLAGSTAKKLGIAEGKKLLKPLVEFYYKDDALQDPFVSDDQVLMMEIINENEIKQLKEKALKVNQLIKELFNNVEIELIDFKIEFGKNSKGEILLGDEITPDCCRLWDQKTQEKLDKDRFRRDLGNIKESYLEVFQRIENYLQKNS